MEGILLLAMAMVGVTSYTWTYDHVHPEDLDECDSGPCKNGGTCTNSDGSYSCKCQNGWTGINCNQDINECNSGPCKNEGTCTNSDGSYLCSCQDGWTGNNCNQDINECNSHPCKNGGACSNSDGSYSCSCQDGWTGNDCTQDINECDGGPCKNGGTCANSDGSYSCSCQDGWTGNNCNQAPPNGKIFSKLVKLTNKVDLLQNSLSSLNSRLIKLETGLEGLDITTTNKPSTNKPTTTNKPSTGGGDKNPGGRKCVLRDGLNPHLSDYNKYYDCAHGKAIEKSCQAGLIFNPNPKVCNWPHNYVCPYN